MIMAKKDSYIVILSFMLTELRLAGNELLCYALIYGYSQNGAGGFFGSRTQLAEALNIARRTATDIIDRLLDKGFIKVQHITIGGVQRCMYTAVIPSEREKTACDEAEEKREPDVPEVQSRDKPPARMRPPTLQEVRDYCLMRKNNVDAQRFFDFYSANGWVQGRGKSIKDWRAAVRTWERGNNLNIGLYEKKVMQDEGRRRLATEIAEIDAAYRGSPPQ